MFIEPKTEVIDSRSVRSAICERLMLHSWRSAIRKDDLCINIERLTAFAAHDSSNRVSLTQTIVADDTPEARCYPKFLWQLPTSHFQERGILLARKCFQK